MLALCVQVLSRDPPSPERPQLSEPLVRFRAPAGWAQQHSTGRRMCGCVSTSGKYVLHQRQFWHMQRLQGASSMYQGGCYQTGASSPGNTLCTAASEGKCTKAAEGHFVPPGATAAKQSVVKCDDIAGVLVDSTTCKGIDKCATCTAPSSGQTAACTACVDGYFAGSSGASRTVCVDPCETCKGANNRCASVGQTPTHTSRKEAPTTGRARASLKAGVQHTLSSNN